MTQFDYGKALESLIIPEAISALEDIRELRGKAMLLSGANPEMSQRTLERILSKLQDEGVIEKVGAARSTAYRRLI